MNRLFAGNPDGFPANSREENPAMKRKMTTVVFVLIFLAGLSLLLYPTVSNYWNSLHQSISVSDYVSSVASVQTEDYEALWRDAVEYNRMIANDEIGYTLTEEQKVLYSRMLQVDDTGVIGYIDIPAVNCTLPIYLDVDEKNLQVAVGHLPWSSLPVGGQDTHCVLSGHRGLPSARLFSDIDRLVVGDRFTLHILHEVLTYEVDMINIVLPEEVGFTSIEKGRDYCTLLTCTPYGVNTHRLLVRGHRVENDASDAAVHVVSEAMQVSNRLTAVLLFVAIMLILTVIYLIWMKKSAAASAAQSPLYKLLKEKAKENENE